MSGDLRQHSVAYFLEPVLAHHDRRAVEVHAYATGLTQDAVTDRLQGLVDHWTGCTGLSDDALAGRIRSDGIDILVDLSGHTGGNRLRVFARKPAPVQVTYLGYAATTGLSAMDYRLTTAVVDPPGQEAYHSEALYRLPRSLWCYRPSAEAPEVNRETPAARHGVITFGSMNNIAKVSPETVALWGEILRRLPGSRLVMTSVPEGSVRATLTERFAAVGVEGPRLVLHGKLPAERFWEVLGGIDIGLDPFPYNGTTTTCETLWMGVPVVTLEGSSAVARSGVALLSLAGLPELIARDEPGYVRIALDLARDLPRLSALRAGLRPRLAASPLRDEPGFTRELEEAYRAMWRRWCASGA
jgi:predicted O-linked N-acetylglucosamine transferase (SPINDLY family)